MFIAIVLWWQTVSRKACTHIKSQTHWHWLGLACIKKISNKICESLMMWEESEIALTKREFSLESAQRILFCYLLFCGYSLVIISVQIVKIHFTWMIYYTWLLLTCYLSRLVLAQQNVLGFLWLKEKTLFASSEFKELFFVVVLLVTPCGIWK